MIQLRQISDLTVHDRIVILRTDFDVPMNHGVIKDRTRIIHSLPTIRYLIKNKAKIVIISHIGRPKGNIVHELSLINIKSELEALLDIKIKFCAQSIGLEAKNAIANLQAGEVLILENLRFHTGEEQNDIAFARELSSFGDIYINDAFACAHRRHASTYGIATILPSAAGLALSQEINNLTTIFYNKSKNPLTIIIGGSKASTKLSLIRYLTTKADYIIVTGIIANICLAAKFQNVSKILSVSLEEELLKSACTLLEHAKNTGCKIILPHDIIVQDTISNNISTLDVESISVESLSNDSRIMDVGYKTLQLITDIVKKSKTVIWNGPAGAFESTPFDHGSKYISKLLADETRQGNICSIAGGGDTIFAINKAGVARDFTYISVGGGAFLAWLHGKELPAINVLKI